MFKAFLIFLFLSLLTFTRVYNLDRTARFIWDESSDLVRMHQFFVERKITLIGPIDETGTKIFSSLTYYMLMPFAILGNFDPVSPVFGSAFWGILTAVLIIYLTYLINKKFVLVTALLVLVWFPLVETSRWAWNPNLIPFWATLGILFFQFKGKLKMFVAGIFLGFTIHSHYLSLFALSGFIGSLIIFSFKEKIFKNVVWIITGIVVTLVPFVIFDLRHPPGLFLTRIMFFSPSAGSESLVAALIKLKVWYEYMLNYYTQIQFLSVLLGIIIPILAIIDFRNRGRVFIYAAAWIVQLIGLMFIYNPGSIYYYYVLPSTIFFFVWLIYPRQGLGALLATAILGILLVGGFMSIVPKLVNSNWQTDIYSVRRISKAISESIKKNDLKNVNIAVLTSPDNNTYGRRYRDLLLIDGIYVKSKDEYPISDHLFVVSTGTEAELRNDPAAEMHYFRKGKLEEEIKIPNSDWKVFQFETAKAEHYP